MLSRTRFSPPRVAVALLSLGLALGLTAQAAEPDRSKSISLRSQTIDIENPPALPPELQVEP
ncbi:MAG TPA: hypothetical protein PK413_09775, partial [Thermoanaerobaculia bacterium]|nr:hypothetical protein [Thermoanaerobaculia bacterium]